MKDYNDHICQRMILLNYGIRHNIAALIGNSAHILTFSFYIPIEREKRKWKTQLASKFLMSLIREIILFYI